MNLQDMLVRIVELNCNPHQKAKIKDYRDQIKQVLEIVIVELIINDKKELRITIKKDGYLFFQFFCLSNQK